MKNYNYYTDIKLKSLHKLSKFITKETDITFEDVLNIIHFNFDLKKKQKINLQIFFIYLIILNTNLTFEYFYDLCLYDEAIGSEDIETLYIPADLKCKLFNYFLANYYKHIEKYIIKIIFKYMEILMEDIEFYNRDNIFNSDEIDFGGEDSKQFLCMIFYLNINGFLHYNNTFFLDKYKKKCINIDTLIINAINKYRYFTPLRRFWIQLVIHYSYNK
jgi:hypothetical protein